MMWIDDYSSAEAFAPLFAKVYFTRALMKSMVAEGVNLGLEHT